MDDPLKVELPYSIAKALEAAQVRAARRAARVDVDRVVGRVLARLAAPSDRAAPTRWFSVPRLVWAAAAVVLLAVAGLAVRRTGRAPGGVTAALPVPVEVSDSLAATQVEALLLAVDSVRPQGTLALVSAVSLDDLTEQELLALLQAMQSDSEGAL